MWRPPAARGRGDDVKPDIAEHMGLHSNVKQREDMRSCSRGAMRPRFASTTLLRKQRAQGKPDADRTRGRAHKAHEWTTGSTGSLRLSLREWVTAYFGLSPVTGLFATVAFRIDDPSPDGSPQDLTPAPGRQDHTTSPSATVRAKGLAGPRAVRRVLAKAVSSAVRPRTGRSLTEKTRPAIPLRARRCRVHRIPPRVHDVSRSAPHPGGTGRACNGDLPDMLSGIFLSAGLDGILPICPAGYFPSSIVRQGRCFATGPCRICNSPDLRFLHQPHQLHRSDDVR